MIAERKAIEQKILELEEELSEYPEGELQCFGNGRYSKWFYKLGKDKKYLPKEQQFFAEKLAKKKYLSLQLNDLLQEKQAIDLYLKHRETHPNRAEALLINKSEFRTLISNELVNIEKDIIDWQNSPYEQNENFLQQKIYKTIIYPDFTIKHPKTGKVYYYEHFGKMDDVAYCKKAYAKMELYSLCGIMPTMQLLATFETIDNPLTPEKVEQLVKQYFVDE